MQTYSCSLNSLIGEEILVQLNKMSPDESVVMKLHAVEQAGIWIESQAITNAMLAKAGVSSAGKTPVLFIPFHVIDFVLSFAEGPSAAH